MTPRPPSTKTRRLCFEAHRYQDPRTGRIVMDCHVCGRMIAPALDEWHADHVTPRADGGSDDIANLAPICAGKGSCHAEKTAKDVKSIAKGKRVSDSVYGVKRSSRAMPGSRGSEWKKKMDGSVVRRDQDID